MNVGLPSKHRDSRFGFPELAKALGQFQICSAGRVKNEEQLRMIANLLRIGLLLRLAECSVYILRCADCTFARATAETARQKNPSAPTVVHDHPRSS